MRQEDNTTTAKLLQDEVLARSNYQSLARVLPQVSEKCFSPGETIYKANARAEHFFLLTSGEVKLVSPGGRESHLVHRRFGEEAASDAEHYLTDAVAATASTAMCIPHVAMKTLIAANPALKTDLLLSLASHLAGEKLERRSTPAAVKAAARNYIRPFGWLLCLILPLLILAFGDRAGIGHDAVLFSAIFAPTVTMWVFSLVDDYIPGLFALMAILITGLVPPPVILSGFASDGFMMALSTLALGTVVVTSGLSYRVMLNLLLRLPNHQFWHGVGLFLTGTILTPIIPTANGRIALVSTFFVDMVESLRLTPQGAAATRLAITCFSGISLFSAMVITSKSVNFAVYGLLTPQGQDHFQWLTWLFTAIIAAAVMLLLNAGIAAIWFRNTELPQLSKAGVAEQLRLLGKMKNREWAAVIGVIFMVLGIITSSIHKVQPPWLGFAMLFGLLLCGTLYKKELKEKVDWTFLLYLSGVTGIVGAFSFLGLDQQLADALPGLGNYMRTNFGLFILMLFALISVIRLAVPINATVVIMAAIFMPIAEANGINAWVLGFVILIFSEGWFMPYQCSYYLQMQEINRGKPLYDEKSFLRFNAVLNLARPAAVYASLPYWKMLGLMS
ncbi:SLC13 family permease [Noviherbaspirillum sp. CPCC 100848]|uniref:SLC13 family permease n=1 Tax=Noviherbaspirillum album TaxID=3080276 RepID=A0ABU6JAM1_9BURK|nr:SLC13 family permease [Noviherbaspirillum sp. CPCC 100848]MEC4720699.1 SLC13 family permease [Noviherbaspirillum sp. CPCC 100848]